MQAVVREVIQQLMNRAIAARYVEAWSVEHVNERDCARFVQMAESELIALRESNFARYRVRPAEYYAWRSAWVEL